MPFIEAPTNFYLGRRFDPTTRRLVDEVVYYDSRDLTTHAVVVGMTGSGKTGLCIDLLEEAVIDNIPSIIIDPKGDITNLLLAFPELQADDFEPWINVDDARRAGMEIDEYAVEVAQQWRSGLATWGIGPERIREYKNNARFSIYTPGSDAGLPISILDAMQAPRDGFEADEELHRERINGIVTALLSLIGKSVEPVKDREHVLIANIFETAWRRGQDLTLEDVILQVQKPPFEKLGVFDIDTFFAEKDRFQLAMELNNIIAAPSFQSWVRGEPMDIQSLLYTPEGKPRVSVFYVAHLNNAERMFIVTLLLENVLAWMRTLSGTTSLRAILYFDEVFGFFPPHPYNPPTKDPLLRLLKQARAFGLGMVLATQNPADIDYKGLSNAGTWFIGKLQTENDKNRVLDGLEGVVTADNGLDIDNLDRLLSSIDPRVFVMHNVHDTGGPIPMHTRWAMSYLRGPLTRQQIRQLMAGQRERPYYPRSEQPGRAQAAPPPASLPEMADPQATPPPATLPDWDAPPQRPATSPEADPPPAPPEATRAASPPPPANAARRREPALPEGYSRTAPAVTSSIAQYYLPTTLTLEQALRHWEQQTQLSARGYDDARLAYEPVLLAQAQVRYADRKSGVTAERSYAYQVPGVPKAGLIQWEDYRAGYIDPTQIGREPAGEAAYGDPSPGLVDSSRMSSLRREVEDYIYKTGTLTVMHNAALNLYGGVGMSRRDFLVQAQNLARERRDEELDKAITQYEKKFDTLEDRLRRKARELSAEQKQYDEVKNEEMFTTGEALLSLLRGRTTYTLSRVSRARRYKGYIQEDLFESEQVIAELEGELDELQARMEQELAAINAKWGELAMKTEEYVITPYKKDIYLDLFGIGWRPQWMVILSGRPLVIPAWNA